MYLCHVKNAFLLFGLLILVRPIIPVVEYVMNYDYISKVLCENKAKPELKCNGKCQLMKELAKASEEEKPLSQEKKQFKTETEVLFLFDFETFDFTFFNLQNATSISDHYINLYALLEEFSVFHPPLLFV